MQAEVAAIEVGGENIIVANQGLIGIGGMPNGGVRPGTPMFLIGSFWHKTLNLGRSRASLLFHGHLAATGSVASIAV